MLNSFSDEDIDLKLLLEAIYLKFQYDFRNYALSSVKRRMEQAMIHLQVDSIIKIQEKVLHESGFFSKLLPFLTIPVTEMFRDPDFFSALRKEVLPFLQTFPSFKVWIAGCSTGEEVYSYAILFQEYGILSNVLIYATDINPNSLAAAKAGVFGEAELIKYEKNYKASGGAQDFFSSYFTMHGDKAVIKAELKKNILFSDHSLATDSVFAEVQLVSCRNVMIYFNKALQDRALGLFYDSLGNRGFLTLGNKESLKFSAYGEKFEEINRQQRIYRKIL